MPARSGGVPAQPDLSADQARRLAIGAQGLTAKRPAGRVDRRHLRGVFDRINVIQIDAVNVLVRSHELPLWARLGPHRRSMLFDALDDGDLFEYWAHVAAIVPSSDHRLYRWRMGYQERWPEVQATEDRRPGFIDGLIRHIADNGPIVASDLEERTTPKQPWWDWDEGKQALENLFGQGRLMVRRRRRDFARLYDLPERVIPAADLAAPTPSEADARKELLMRAARAMGVATASDLADYHRQRLVPGANGALGAKGLIDELVEDGALRAVTVEGWKGQAYLDPAATIPRATNGVTLLSPFDSLVWNRDRNLRLWDFHYRIEIYTPAAKRVHGYYVLPLLVDGRMVGRVDLKADRSAGTLRVRNAHTEPPADPADVADRLVPELRAMADWLELDHLASTSRGDLATALAAMPTWIRTAE